MNYCKKLIKCSIQNNLNFTYYSLSTSSIHQFKYSQLEIKKCLQQEKKTKPNWATIPFGYTFSDHMLQVEWYYENGWGKPVICPMQNLSLHPSAKVLHYAEEIFEGTKAYRGVDDVIRLFRPDQNIQRMRRSAKRMGFPNFNSDDLLLCLKKLIQIDADWVPPAQTNCSLYIRPTLIGTEGSLPANISKRALFYIFTAPVGSYFSSGFKAISLLADPQYVRAWPGGAGDNKLGSNYGPTLAIAKIAEEKGLDQMLWLYGDDHQLTEVGLMNIFVYLENENGERELVTPSLNNRLILPGVTRLSIVELARSWNEFKVSERVITMKEIKHLVKQNKLLEIFGAGTALVISPVGKIHYDNEDLIIPTLQHKDPLAIRFYNSLCDIHYGRIPHQWAVPI